MAKKAKVKAQSKDSKTVAPKKATELEIINGKATITTTATAPYHKEGIEITVIESLAVKMISKGWAK